MSFQFGEPRLIKEWLEDYRRHDMTEVVGKIRTRVMATKLSTTGQSMRVLLGNTWYGAKPKCGLKKDDLIDAEVFDHDDYGPCIKTFTRVPEVEPPQESTPVIKDFMKGAEPWWAKFVSNCCGQAIAAGTIKESVEIRLWAKHAYHALEGCMEQFGKEPGDDDGI